VQVPFLELSGLLERQWLEQLGAPKDPKDAKNVPAGAPPDSVRTVEELAGPRVIKTHLSLDMLPKQVVRWGSMIPNFIFHWPTNTASTDYSI